MFTWLTEDATYVYAALAVVALVFIALYFQSRRTLNLVLLAGTLLFGLLIGGIEYLIVTDRELIETNVRELARAAEKGDIATIDRLLTRDFTTDVVPATDRATVLKLAKEALPAKEQRKVALEAFEIASADGGKTYTCRCQAWVRGEFSGYHVELNYPLRLEFVFVKEDDVWKAKHFKASRQGDPIQMPR